MIRDRRLLALAASLVLGCAGMEFASAQEKFTTGAETWKVDSSGVLSTPDWPAASVLKLTLTTVRDEAPRPPAPAPSPAPAPPQLSFRSDHNSHMIGMLELAGGSKMSVFLRRSLAFDAERRAIRVLDIITSGEDRDREITLTYTTRWQPEYAKRIPTPRQFLVPGASVSGGVAAGVMDDPKLPILMCIYGVPVKSWKREVTADPESLRWSYTGTLPAKQRILVLHWLALTDDVKTETVRQVRERLVGADGMPKDAFVDEQTLKELVNFPMPMEGKRSEAPQGPAGLPLVEALGEVYRITPTSGHDHLVLNGMPLLQGDFEAANLQFTGADGDEVLSLEKIAAIEGGAGIGRRMRVYLRDGSVASGRLTWDDGKFLSKTLGTVKIDPENVTALVLRTNDVVDGRTPFAALWATPARDIKRMDEAPPGKALMRWAAGTLEIAWKDIATLRQLPQPDLGQEVTLRDGSLIRGWVTSTLPDTGQCLAYATTWPGLITALDRKEAAPPMTALHLRTTNDSRLTGSWADRELSLATPNGEVRIATGDIRRLEVTAGASGEPVKLEITSLAGTTVQGAAASEMCAWTYQGQPVAVPWPLISEIARPEPSPANP